MAFQKQDKIVKSFNRKRKSKFHDDDNFHLIIAPGAVQWYKLSWS